MTNSTFWIADSGGSKTEWALCHDGKVVRRHRSEGLHPRYLAERTATEREVLAQALHPGTEPVYFYGAGCARESAAALIREELLATGFSEVVVFPDSLGACRSLLGNEPGTVAILGTGSIVLMYDGSTIVKRFGGFGPLIGDEGSGLHFARLVVRDYLAHRIDNKELVKQLGSILGTKDEVLSQLAGSNAIQWLAGLGKKLAGLPLEHYHYTNLVQWLDSWFPETTHLKRISITGTYGAAQEEVVRKVLRLGGIAIDTITESPLEGLINYHCRNILD